MIIMNGGRNPKGGALPAGEKLHGYAAELYQKHAEQYTKEDWILATFCNMTAAILEQRELINTNENRIRDLEHQLHEVNTRLNAYQEGGQRVVETIELHQQAIETIRQMLVV